MTRIHILRPGTHAGHRLECPELEQIARVYDVALHEAPVVIGHPGTADPAYAWVEGLDVDADGLHARLAQVDPEFSEQVRAGRWRKVSCSLYRPGSADNPVTSGWYLRHVGFLGARPPAVKGLKPAELDESADAVELDDTAGLRRTATMTRMFRALREWLIDQTNVETADRVLPTYDIDSLADAEFAETATNGDPMPPDNDDAATARATALDAREAALDAREKSAAERSAADFAECAVADGRILPRDKEALTSLLVALPPEDLAEEGAASRSSLRDIVSRLPAQVPYGEVAAPDAGGDRRRVGAIGLPAGYSTDSSSEALHRRALDYAERNGVAYEAAVLAVGDDR